MRLDETGQCACGRHSGLILSATEGRIYNVTLTCAGRLVTSSELDNNLSVIEDIDEYKLEQITTDSYDLHVVSRQPDKPQLTAAVASILKELYGKEANVTVIQ